MNCAAVWAAVGGPIYAGDPGYSASLDADGDGIACELNPTYSNAFQNQTVTSTAYVYGTSTGPSPNQNSGSLANTGVPVTTWLIWGVGFVMTGAFMVIVMGRTNRRA